MLQRLREECRKEKESGGPQQQSRHDLEFCGPRTSRDETSASSLGPGQLVPGSKDRIRASLWLCLTSSSRAVPGRARKPDLSYAAAAAKRLCCGRSCCNKRHATPCVQHWNNECISGKRIQHLLQVYRAASSQLNLSCTRPLGVPDSQEVNSLSQIVQTLYDASTASSARTSLLSLTCLCTTVPPENFQPASGAWRKLRRQRKFKDQVQRGHARGLRMSQKVPVDC